MAYVTLCPQCTSGFLVQPEHFSQADGWVRCGHCAHVFQLDQHLYEMDQPQSVYGHPSESLALPESEAIEPMASLDTAEPSPSNPSLRWPVGWCIGLSLVLILQTVMHFRHSIAGRVPELTPWLAAACRPWACEVHPPVAPDQVALSTSGFRRLGEHRFVLEGSVQNLGDSHLQTPALWLELTSQGEDRVRKVIKPQDMGLETALRPRGTHVFAVQFELDAALSASIDGFHAVLFYP